MVIGIHAVAAFRSKPTGVETYTRRLLGELFRLPDASRHRFLLYSDVAVGRGTVNRERGTRVQVQTLRSPLLWTQGRLSWEMRRRPPDVLFVPAQALPRVLPKRTVVTVHGLEFERVPQLYSPARRAYLRFVTRDAVRRATAFIAVSEATKDDLVERYAADPRRITVIHHGVPVPRLAGKVQPAGYTIPAPYFLYVGRVELSKNVDGLLRAFVAFRKRSNAPYRLLLAGGDGYGAGRIRRIGEDPAAREAVRFLGYVSDEQKWSLLSNATALVFPSWAEGFGLPIVEAQSVGTPVITSNATAMPEVAGENGALFVTPGDVAALAEAMWRIANDAHLRRWLVAQGRENLKRFSWQKTAKETLRVLLENS